jgi:hypothetical protein
MTTTVRSAILRASSAWPSVGASLLASGLLATAIQLGAAALRGLAARAVAGPAGSC